jgi:hypothetical protein
MNTDYSMTIPKGYVYCCLDGCTKAATCIRHFAGEQLTYDQTFGLSIYPTHGYRPSLIFDLAGNTSKPYISY